MPEASQLLEAIASLGSGTEDPLTEPETLARAVELGLLDAPHLAGRPGGLGQVVTRAVEGRIEAVDPDSGAVIPERERIARVLKTQ